MSTEAEEKAEERAVFEALRDKESFPAQVARSVRDGISTLTDNVTGKSLERKIDEFTDALGRIVLSHNEAIRGLDERLRRFEAAAKRIQAMLLLTTVLASLGFLISGALALIVWKNP